MRFPRFKKKIAPVSAELPPHIKLQLKEVEGFLKDGFKANDVSAIEACKYISESRQLDLNGFIFELTDASNNKFYISMFK